MPAKARARVEKEADEIHPPGAKKQTVLTQYAGVKKHIVTSQSAAAGKQTVKFQPPEVEEQTVETQRPGAKTQPPDEKSQAVDLEDLPDVVRNARFVQLEDVPASQDICEGMDAEGQFKLPTLIGNRAAGPWEAKCFPLTDRYLIALILTECCCNERKGKVYVRLNAYNDAESGCQAILAIVPKAYLGWRADLYQSHGPLEFVGDGWADGRGAFYPADKKTLEKHQFWNPSDIVRRLDEMYFEKKASAPVKLQTIIDGVIEFRRQLAYERDPYSAPANPKWRRENRSGPNASRPSRRKQKPTESKSMSKSKSKSNSKSKGKSKIDVDSEEEMEEEEEEVEKEVKKEVENDDNDGK
ncbi:MAG: hypothetical protein Q9223_002299 [Gallowayella weberi]